MRLHRLLLTLGVLLGLCSPVFAHPNHGFSVTEGLWSGLAHPWLGLDHLLAMFAVGLLGVQLGGRALWGLPVTFVGTMAAGCGLSVAGLPAGHYPLALSAVVLGAALAAGRNYPLLLAVGVTGMFGVLHGHAHGTELSAAAAPGLYLVGLLLATMMLHGFGVVAGLTLSRHGQGLPALRVSGAITAAVGLIMLVV